jgi:predicted dehydrogenase
MPDPTTHPPDPTPSQRLRVGLAGADERGLALWAAAATVPGVIPVAVVDPADGAAPLSILPDVVHFQDYEAMIETAGLDAVILATSPAQQARYARMALTRGIHALVQLPLAPTQAATDILLDTAGESGARLVVDEPYRLAPATVAARAALAQRRLGTLLAVQARFHHLWEPRQSWCSDPAQGGVLPALGAPLLALLLHLLDLPPTLLTGAFMRRAGQVPDGAVEDFAVLTGSIAGVPLHCEVSWHAPLPRTDARVTLRGTAGVLTWYNVKGSLTEFAAHLSYHQGEEPLASGPAGLSDDTLRAFAAACTAPLAPDLTPYRLLAALLRQAADLAGPAY